MFQVGDLVVIINDVNNYIYKIKNIDEKICIIGYCYRLIRYVSVEEIRLALPEEINKEQEEKETFQNKIFRSAKIREAKALFGRVLHIDGDEEYLKSCLDLYKEVGIFAEGVYLSEKEAHKKIENILLQTTPDIIVITGHDAYKGNGFSSLENYENSKHFIKTIRVIRKHFSIDDVVVIAGACGSHFEALIASGANFASSPKRLNTHTYDPAIVAIKVASTSINRMVDFNGIIKYIDNGRDAIGGIETSGKMRLLL